MAGHDNSGDHPGAVWLVGAGIVGRAILKAHLQAGCPVRLADADPDALNAAVNDAERSGLLTKAVPIAPLGGEIPAVAIAPSAAAQAMAAGRADRTLVIESIAERLEVKRRFFQNAERWFDEATVFGSNTSSLRIGSIAESLRRPGRLCGMHFFMPVQHRAAVEVVPSAFTAREAIAIALDHLQRIGKQPLLVADGPAFVVNRLLVPYLNQALLLVTEGASSEQIERAALAFGMPMSPLELVDWIGTPTAFDAGRAYWQAFPHRLDPAPLLPAMVKRNRWGRSVGCGFYDYPGFGEESGGERSGTLAEETQHLCQRYSRQPRQWSDDEVLELLSVPMWIEAACLMNDRIVETFDAVETAMSGGLGYTRPGRWFDFFEQLGTRRMVAAIEHWSGHWRSMRVPPQPPLGRFLELSSSPREAVAQAIGLTQSSTAD